MGIKIQKKSFFKYSEIHEFRNVECMTLTVIVLFPEDFEKPTASDCIL